MVCVYSYTYLKFKCWQNWIFKRKVRLFHERFKLFFFNSQNINHSRDFFAISIVPILLFSEHKEIFKLISLVLCHSHRSTMTFTVTYSTTKCTQPLQYRRATSPGFKNWILIFRKKQLPSLFKIQLDAN